MRALIVSMLVALAVPASAQPRGSATAITDAKAHFKQGKAFLDQHLYDDAIREFQAAYELSPLPELLFNIAQAYRLKGEPDAALVTYKRFLELQTEGQAADEARTHVAALTADKERHDAEAKQRADAEAQRKADEDARRKADEAVVAERAREAADRERRDDEDRRRREDEIRIREDAERRDAEARRRLELDDASRTAWNADRARHARARRAGYTWAGIGLGCGAVAGLFAYLGGRENHTIESGGFTTASEIGKELTAGKVFNYLAWGFAVPAAVGLAVGTPILVIHRDRGDFKVTPIATADGAAVILSGMLP